MNGSVKIQIISYKTKMGMDVKSEFIDSREHRTSAQIKNEIKSKSGLNVDVCEVLEVCNLDESLCAIPKF